MNTIKNKANDVLTKEQKEKVKIKEWKSSGMVIVCIEGIMVEVCIT